jgi:hypothetical protein
MRGVLGDAAGSPGQREEQGVGGTLKPTVIEPCATMSIVFEPLVPHVVSTSAPGVAEQPVTVTVAVALFAVREPAYCP